MLTIGSKLAIIEICVIGLLMSVFNGVAQSQSNQLGKWWKNPEYIKKLNLNPQQIQEIEKIWIESKKQLLDLKVEFDKKQEALQELIAKEPSNENLLRDQIHRVVEARAKLMEANLLRITKVRKVLTPEQRKQLRELREQRTQAQKK